MKKALLTLFLIALALPALGSQRDVLMTPDGTLYTIQTRLASEHPEVSAASMSYLVLSTRRGSDVKEEIVTPTTDRGTHISPSIVHDTATGMVYAFWVRRLATMDHELVFASRSPDGVWSSAEVFETVDGFNFRDNLRTAVTRRVSADDGSLLPESGVSVHALWREFDPQTNKESANYAMLVIENGSLLRTERLDLRQFVTRTVASVSPGTVLDNSVLTQPLIEASELSESVLLTFGDLQSHTLQQVRVRPTRVGADVRIRIPIGRRERDLPSPGLVLGPDDRLDAVQGDTGRLALYVRSDEKLAYVVLDDNGRWSDPLTIAFDATVTSDTAVAAIRRFVSE